MPTKLSPELTALVSQYGRPETRELACQKARTLMPEEKRQLFRELDRRNNILNGFGAALVPVLGAPVVLAGVFVQSGTWSRSIALAVIAASFLVVIVGGFVLQPRIGPPLRLAAGLVCQLDGQDVVLPVLRRLNRSQTTFAASGDGLGSRTHALECLARNLALLPLDDSPFSFLEEQYLVNTARWLSRGSSRGDWSERFVSGVRRLAPVFKSQRAKRLALSLPGP